MRRPPIRLPGGALAVLLALGALGPAPAARGDGPEAPEEVPVAVEATVDEAEAADTGLWTVHLAFSVEEDVLRPYRVEVRLVRMGTDLLVLDHVPDPPVRSWRAGQRVAYDLPVPVPLEAGLKPGDLVGLLVAFQDPETRETVPPRTAELLEVRRLRVLTLHVPDLGPTDPPEVLTRILERAAALANAGRKPDAWRVLELGLRRAVEDDTKYRFRDALLGLGPFAPPPLSPVEAEIVRRRIDEERTRWLRLVAGRHYDRGRLHAALKILEDLGGTLAEDADAAVLGALDDARRVERDLQDIRVRILARITDEEKAKAQAAIERLGATRALLERAEAWTKDGELAGARWLLRYLMTSGDGDLAPTARGRLEAVEAAMLAAIPPAEQDLVDEALHEPAFDRTATSLSQKFVLIGPRTLVEGIPEDSRLRFDLAYVFQTDLFGRLPNPAGDRVTVYFKELWDFGGGVGGGKTIDIGRADPDARAQRIDNGLLYHELTHCVDDTNPIFHGFREGLANFGAAYTFEALGQRGDDLHAFASNLRAFREEYLGRDLEYWRIQNYGPSAGFFLHFVDKYASRGRLHDWKPYRRFFREYRAAPVHDGREPYLARVLAYYLVRAFGEGAFDDLVAFRFPLEESDRAALAIEVGAFAEGDHRVRRLGGELDPFPASPLRRDLVAREMLETLRGRRDEEGARRISKERLGVVHDWWVIGPFRQSGADPGACIFPPEQEIDLAKEYPGEANVCTWRRAGSTPMVTVDPIGWVGIHFAYQDETASYALTHVTVPEDVDAYVHGRADDDLTVFVEDRLVEAYQNRDPNASDPLWWRGPLEHVPDQVRLPVHLHRGRNKVLVKVRNRGGDAGFVLAFSLPDGRPVPGLVVEPDPAPGGTTRAAPPKREWRTVEKHAFRGKSISFLQVAVGRFEVRNRLLRGTDTGGGVLWRRYTVRPGFPRDAPSNLAWLREKETEGIEDLRLTLDLAPDGGGTPKLAVTLQGEGGLDGLSGWTLVVHPHGGEAVQARLERYDRLVYQTPPLPAPGGEIQPLVITVVGDRLSATLADLVLFDGVSIHPIPGRHRIGFMTYGPNLAIESMRLEAGR